MPKSSLWKHTHPEGTCRDFDRLIPTRETGKHRGAVACKLCLDWLERVDEAKIPAPASDSHRPTYVQGKVAPNLFSVFCSCGRSSFGAMVRDAAEEGHTRHIRNPEGGDYRDAEATARLLAIIGPIPDLVS